MTNSDMFAIRSFISFFLFIPMFLIFVSIPFSENFKFGNVLILVNGFLFALYITGIWTFTLTLITSFFLEITVGIINFILQDNKHYVSKDKTKSFYIRNLNPLRHFFGKMPIWITPSKGVRKEDLLYLANSIKLWNDIENTLKHLNWSSQRKNTIVKQSYIACKNLTSALWKLEALHQKRHSIIEQFDQDGKSRQEIDFFSKRIRDEMQHTLEELTSFSVYLVKSRVSDISASSDIDNLVKQIEISSKELEEATKVYGQGFAKESSDYSLWSYTKVFVVVVAVFTISSMFVQNSAFTITVTGSLFGLLVIGILKLRDNEKISENSFTQIVIEFLKSIRLLK